MESHFEAVRESMSSSAWKAMDYENEEQRMEAMERQGGDRSKAMLQKRRQRTATRQRRLAAKTRVRGSEHGSDGKTGADRSKAMLQKRRRRTADQQRRLVAKTHACNGLM